MRPSAKAALRRAAGSLRDRSFIQSRWSRARKELAAAELSKHRPHKAEKVARLMMGNPREESVRFLTLTPNDRLFLLFVVFFLFGRLLEDLQPLLEHVTQADVQVLVLAHLF